MYLNLQISLPCICLLLNFQFQMPPNHLNCPISLLLSVMVPYWSLSLGVYMSNIISSFNYRFTYFISNFFSSRRRLLGQGITLCFVNCCLKCVFSKPSEWINEITDESHISIRVKGDKTHLKGLNVPCSQTHTQVVTSVSWPFLWRTDQETF